MIRSLTLAATTALLALSFAGAPALAEEAMKAAAPKTEAHTDAMAKDKTGGAMMKKDGMKADAMHKDSMHKDSMSKDSMGKESGKH